MFPVAAVIILFILALLLRSVIAPWYLMASAGLGFGATLGASVLVFQVLRGQAGLVFLLPVYMYLFVVALGTDYNILTTARLREETRGGRDPRTAATLALRHTGPTIGAAGVILAGTFASLTLAGNTTLPQLGFAVSCGIALGSVRHGDVLPAQPHRADRPPRLVARPRRQASHAIGIRCWGRGPSATVRPGTRPRRNGEAGRLDDHHDGARCDRMRLWHDGRRLARLVMVLRGLQLDPVRMRSNLDPEDGQIVVEAAKGKLGRVPGFATRCVLPE